MLTRKRQTAPTPTSVAEEVSGIGYEALRFLTQQQLDHTPGNYALAWRTKGDRRSLVAMAVDAILMEGRRLSQADADRIMLAEAKRACESDSVFGPHQEALRHHTLRLADLTAGAATQSSEFGRDLSEGLLHLAEAPGTIEQIVTAMVERTHAVEAQLTDASKEIEKLRQQVEATQDDAHRDALTGLLNRRGILRTLAGRPRSATGMVAICDVDHFKSINDRYGHGVGDRVLKGVATSLTDSSDVHAVARWGGEEFLIVMDGIDADRATMLLERVRADLAARSFKLRATDEPLGTVTVSIGAAALPGGSPDPAIEAADRMLYAAKAAGRNRVMIDRPARAPAAAAG